MVLASDSADEARKNKTACWLSKLTLKARWRARSTTAARSGSSGSGGGGGANCIALFLPRFFPPPCQKELGSNPVTAGVVEARTSATAAEAEEEEAEEDGTTELRAMGRIRPTVWVKLRTATD